MTLIRTVPVVCWVRSSRGEGCISSLTGMSHVCNFIHPHATGRFCYSGFIGMAILPHFIEVETEAQGGYLLLMVRQPTVSENRDGYRCLSAGRNDPWGNLWGTRDWMCSGTSIASKGIPVVRSQRLAGQFYQYTSVIFPPKLDCLQLYPKPRRPHPKVFVHHSLLVVTTPASLRLSQVLNVLVFFTFSP